MIIVPDHVFVHRTTLKSEIALYSDPAMKSKISALAFETLGCFTYHYTDAQAQEASDFLGGEVTPGDHIVFIEDFLVNLTAEEQNAVLAHELGHVVHGHLKNRTGSGVVNDLGIELEADHYAINNGVTGKQLVTAITKLIHTGDELLQKIPGISEKIRPGGFAEKVFADPILQKRMSTLLSQ